MLGTALFLLIILLAISVPVAAVMGVLGLALNQFYSSMPLYRAMGDEIIWNSSSEYILIAIPMFVMLGEVLLGSGIAARVYNAIAKWLSWLPGGLMHANIGTCAIFAATSGSSVATAATVGVVALPQIKIHNYDEHLFLGTLLIYCVASPRKGGTKIETNRGVTVSLKKLVSTRPGIMPAR
jgi:C4-dicarboxylate transporter, DctM subunit